MTYTFNFCYKRHRNGREIWDSRRHSIVTKGGVSTLTFPSVNHDCEGVIECRVENKAGKTSSTGRLFVEGDSINIL